MASHLKVFSVKQETSDFADSRATPPTHAGL